MIVSCRRQWKRLGVHARRILRLVALVTVVVVVPTTSAAAAIATVAPAVFHHAVLLVELPDDPTVIRVMREPLVEDTVSAAAALVALRAIVTMVLLVRLHREDSSILALGVLWLGLWRCHLWCTMNEQPSLLGLGALVNELEKPDHGGQLIIHAELFFHLDVEHARGEDRDDFLIGDPRDLVAHLTEALDVLPKRFALVLAHNFEVIFVKGRSYVGMKLVTNC
jgi:hypothetical protein